MPFQSEKQRRYLWANEPEIARDWTDTYGSGIAKALGGRIGLWTGGFPDFFQMTPENMATARSTPWSTALNQDFNPWSKDYRGFTTGYRGADKSGLGKYVSGGLKSLAGMYEPGSNIGGATNLMRKMALGASKHLPKLLSKAALPFELLRASPVNADEANMTSEDFAALANKNQGVDVNAPSSNVPQRFNQQYLQGSGWLNDARTADEMAQLPIDPLRNKRQKVTDFLSRFIPGAGVAKMLRPDANEAYGNVAGLYPEEVFGMQEFGSGEDLRTDPWGKNIVSFAGDYEQGKKDWWDKYGKMVYKTKRMQQKQAWHKQAVEKIRQEEAAREQRKRAQVEAMSDQNRIQGVGGWDSGMARDEAFMTGEREEGQPLSDVMGSFNRGGLAGLWPR